VEIAAVFGGGTPQSEHRAFIIAGPKKDDVAGPIAVSELQSNDAGVKVVRRFRLRDRQMRFVQVQLQS
jgi:hypothetical protein